MKHEGRGDCGGCYGVCVCGSGRSLRSRRLDGWTVGALIGVGLVLLGLLRVLLFD